MRRCLPVLFFASLLACRRDAPRPPEAPATIAPTPLRFAWPVGARATVTERVLKKGRRATTRYDIVTQREGSTILVYYRDFAFLELEGFDLDDPTVREQIAALESQVAGAIPPYRIAADGTWLGCGELDTMLDGLVAVLPAAHVATFREMMANPKIRAVVEAKIRDVWQAWVEGWLGLELAPGERIEGSSAIEIAGVPALLPYVIERLPGNAATIELRATSEISGATAQAMVGVLLEEIIAAFPDRLGAKGRETAAVAAELAVRRVHLREVTLDRATMLPRRALSRVTIVVQGEQTVESIESHEWIFAWDGEAAAVTDRSALPVGARRTN